MLGEFIFPEQSKMNANDFVMGEANKKRRLHSSQRLPWSSRMGCQVVSTTIFDDSWIFDWRCDAWQIYLSRAIKTKANDFMMGVANEKQHLRSSQQLPWSSRTGRQVVSTTIFEWLLNLWMKIWMNYRVVAADNLLEGRTNRVSKRLGSLALGS